MATLASITNSQNRANVAAWANDSCDCQHRRQSHRVACTVHGCPCTNFGWRSE